MNKTILSLCIGLLAFDTPVHAQQAFWNYDDDNQEISIPLECDGIFDESRGGVYIPTAAEMYTRGEEFLINPDPVERNKAGYCLIAAALQGHIPAQYRVAQLYSKGIILPQDDLSAYRWAFLAALNGHPEAERLTLMLERFLTTAEIEKATAPIPPQIPAISKRKNAELAAQEKIVREKQAKLDRINAEIDSMLGIKVQIPVPPEKSDAELAAQKATPKGSIFTDKDRKK